MNEIYYSRELESLLGHLPADLLDLLREAYEEGYNDGHDDGRQEGYDEGYAQCELDMEYENG